MRVINKSKADLGKGDPIVLWEKIISKIPDDDFFKGMKILCVAAGYGSDAKVLVQRLKKLGWNNEEIQDTIWLNDISLSCTRRLSLTLNFKNVITCDFLYWNLNMKFDVIVGNPPYLRGLHLKFLEKSLSLLSDSGKLIFIHPGEWLTQIRLDGKGSYYKELRDELSPITKSIEFLNGSEEMDVGMYVPLSITFLDKTNKDKQIDFKNLDNKSYFVNHLNDINPWAGTKSIFKIINKINLKDNLKNKIRKYNGDFYISLSSITGNGSIEIKYYDGIVRKTGNMYNFINNTCNFISDRPLIAKAQGKKEIGNEKPWISFNSETEAKNCLGYLTKTKFIKFLIVIYKIDQHADSIYKYIPMLDFNQEWTDIEINKFYNFSVEDIQLIENVVNKITK